MLVFPHWGPNMATEPLPRVRRAAAELLTAGATAVAGHSAHVFQGVAGRVLYDLGDFVDDYATHPALRNDLGALWLLHLAGGVATTVDVVPLHLGYACTELVAGADAAWVHRRFRAACERLGTSVRDDGDRLTVDLGTAATPPPGAEEPA